MTTDDTTGDEESIIKQYNEIEKKMTTDEDLYDQWEQLYSMGITLLSSSKEYKDKLSNTKDLFLTMSEGEEKERIRRTLRRMIESKTN
jgi:hypothetical protein